MKIRTQDGRQCVEFGDCYVISDPIGIGVCVRSVGDQVSVLAGNYADVARAKGVIQEIAQAYEQEKRLFYMPVE